MITPSGRSLALCCGFLMRSSYTLFFLFFFCAFLSFKGGAQQGRHVNKNLPTFDDRLYHFGFKLAYNRAGLYMDPRPREGIATRDSLQRMRSIDQPGFDLGIISSLHLNKNVSLRFLPALSFQDRVMRYAFQETDSTVNVVDKRIGSTFIDVPLNLKYRTDRVNNFAAYLIGGARWSIDMASAEDVDNSSADEILLKMHRNDYAAQIGGGFDFFLKYFKFGIELKLSVGLRDMLIHEDTPFARPIESARTRKYLLSFTFEG